MAASTEGCDDDDDREEIQHVHLVVVNSSKVMGLGIIDFLLTFTLFYNAFPIIQICKEVVLQPVLKQVEDIM